MNKEKKVQLFQNHKIRTHWDEEKECWYFSVQDVVQVLSESKDVKQYIKKMKSRDSELKANWGTICTPAKMTASDGKLGKSLFRDISRPFTGRIAVKVINHLGDEVMKVFGVQ